MKKSVLSFGAFLTLALFFPSTAIGQSGAVCDSVFHWVYVAGTNNLDGPQTGFEYLCQTGAMAQSQEWEPSIRKFEEQDKVNPPKLGCIVFAGSSSIVRWETLVNEMKPLDVINRGFGGSQYSDLNQYAKRIVIVYHPRAVVVYEGDNDLATGSSKTPESVAHEARAFVQLIHSALPETWVYIISIKPSKSRRKEWPRMKEANRMIRQFAGKQKRVQYIDVASSMFDNRGNLRADLFGEDGLHPTQKCYALWTSIIKPVLLKRFGIAKSIDQMTTERQVLPTSAPSPATSWMLESAV